VVFVDVPDACYEVEAKLFNTWDILSIFSNHFSGIRNGRGRNDGQCTGSRF
jgi:hypothetical protein